jgi:AraC-like DNA-binding protein
LLRRLTGLSLEQLIRRQRMHRAAQLLADTDQSILEIVAAVGYQSVGAFYAAFEQHHGLAPGAYREQLTGTRLG